MTLELGQITAATDANNHWKAALLITKELGEVHEFELIQALEFNAFDRGYSHPHEIAARRSTINAVLARYPEEFADKIRGAL